MWVQNTASHNAQAFFDPPTFEIVKFELAKDEVWQTLRINYFCCMKNTDITFRSMTEKNWSKVAEIYRQGIKSGNATFEKEVPTWEEWNNKHLKNCRIVAIANDEIVAWAALLPVSTRQCYSGVAEVSVYVASDYRDQKVGKQLLTKLIECSESEGIWTLQASVFPENRASIHSLKQLGFRIVGERRRIGKMEGNWRDTILLERRSETVGQ